MTPVLIAILLIIALVAAVAVLALGQSRDTRQAQLQLEEVVAERPASFLRVYSGQRMVDTHPLLRSEAAWLLDLGYVPTSHTWAPGEWSSVAFVVALLLSLFGIGLVLFAYMWTVRPYGALSVVYTLTLPTRPVPGQ